MDVRQNYLLVYFHTQLTHNKLVKMQKTKSKTMV